METKDSKAKYYPLFLLIFFFFGILHFKYVMLQPFIDVGREFLIPEAILDGNILYKDILNIYGALPYFISALFCKIFGIKLTTFLLMNSITALMTIFGVFFLCREFLSEAKSFVISLGIMMICFFNLSLFNYTYPYSICYIQGLLGYIFSIYFLVKFFKTEKYNHLYFSCLVGGFGFACKNEFIFLPFLIFFSILFYKKANFKTFLSSVLCFSFFPLLQLLILYISGLNFHSFIDAFNLIKKSALSPAMIDFHNKIGMQLNFNFLSAKIYSVLFWFFGFLIYKFFLKTPDLRKNTTGYILFILLFLFFKTYLSLKLLVFFLPVALFIFTLLNIKKIIKSPELFILSFGALFASLKTFFCLELFCYGYYTVILLIVLTFCFIYNFLKVKNNAIIIMFLIFSSLTFLISSVVKTMFYSEKINVYEERIETSKENKELMNCLISWIELNTDKEDKILVFPEGEIINYLTKRKTDYKLYSLHDIFIETYGEKCIKERIKSNHIKFIFDISDFNLSYALSNHTYKTNFIGNLLKDDFKMVMSIPLQKDKVIVIYEKIKSKNRQ